MESIAGRGIALFWLRLVGYSLIPAAVTGVALSLGDRSLAGPVAALGVGLALLAPLPLAYGAARRGALEGVLAVAVAALATSAAMGSEQGFFFFLQTAPLVFGVNWVLKSPLPAYLPVLGTVAMVAFAAMGGLVLSAAASGTAVDKLWWETADPFGFVTQPPPPAPADQPGAEQLREQMLFIMGIWKRLFAGIWVGSLILLSLFYAVVTRGVLLQRGDIPPDRPPLLAGWTLPWPFVGAFIALGFAIVLGQGPLRTTAANAMVPLATLYGVQGMVVTGHLFAVWRVPPLARFLGFFLLALWSPLVLIAGVGLAGLFDTWFDFRRRFLPPVAPPPTE